MLAGVMLLTTGCAGLTASDGISMQQAHAASVLVACGAFEPIRYSSHDTAETQRQARAHNAAGISVCGWRP